MEGLGSEPTFQGNYLLDMSFSGVERQGLASGSRFSLQVCGFEFRAWGLSRAANT